MVSKSLVKAASLCLPILLAPCTSQGISLVYNTDTHTDVGPGLP